MGVRGIKSKIALNVGLLLLLSAIATYLLVVTVLQSVWIRSDIHHHEKYILSIAKLFLTQSPIKGDEKTIEAQHGSLSAMLRQSGLSSLIVIGLNKSEYFKYTSKMNHEGLLKPLTLETLTTKKRQQKTLEKQWAFFWLYPRTIHLSLPVKQRSNDEMIGAVTAVISIEPLHLFWGNAGKAILFYILINSIILTAAGLYRIFRIYLKPIDRIIKQADSYHDREDPFFVFRREDNELNRLSSSLNRMLKRISDDKKTLQETVLSLEQSNEELKRAQSEILRAEKMASIGRLAAGIAHEIGNPIGIVLGYLDLLKGENLSPEDKIDFLIRAEKETLRINNIIKQLLDLARPKDTSLKPLSMHSFLQDIISVMTHQPLMKNIDVELHCDADVDCVRANEEQMRQILINLMLNSADAIHAKEDTEPGAIVVATCLKKNEQDQTKDDLVITVTDNGTGISSKDLPAIFDPFFTTKEPGKGTGLGLSVSYMIVEQMGGTISAESVNGKGTTIEIRLLVYNGDMRISDRNSGE